MESAWSNLFTSFDQSLKDIQPSYAFFYLFLKPSNGIVISTDEILRRQFKAK